MWIRLLLAFLVILVFLVGNVWWLGWRSRVDRLEAHVHGQSVLVELHRHDGAYYLRSQSARGPNHLIRVAEVQRFPQEPQLRLHAREGELSVAGGGQVIHFEFLQDGLAAKPLP